MSSQKPNTESGRSASFFLTRESRIALVQKQLDAYNARDIEAFVACFHPEVQVRQLLAKTEMNGIADFKAGYGSMFASCPELHCELKSRTILQDTVLDEEWVTGNPRAPEGIHTVAIYAFRDGLIDRVWFPR